MSDFTYQPAYGAAVDHEPRVQVAPFGDGYEQRVGDGINTDLEKWDLVFTRVESDIDAIDTQLQGYGGETAFTWTPSGFSEVTVVCRKWRRTLTTKGVQALAAMFERVPA